MKKRSNNIIIEWILIKNNTVYNNCGDKAKIKTKLNKRNFEQMTLEELQKEVVNKGIKLDKRNGKKTLISLLLKS